MIQYPAFIDQEEDQRLKAALAAVQVRHGVERVPDARIRPLVRILDGFEVFRGCHAVWLVDAWDVGAPAAALCALQVDTEYSTGKHKHVSRDSTVVGLLRLPVDAGRAVIRPETISDKLAELLGAREIDFAENPAFSRRYHVLASDEPTFRRLLVPPALTVLAGERDLHLEFAGRNALIHRPGEITPERAAALADVAVALAGALRQEKP